MIPFTTQRLISRGDLPQSDGGIYNPGAWIDPHDGSTRFVARVESDYSFRADVIRAERFTYTGTCHALPKHQRLPFGMDQDCRFEDLRPFVFQGDVLVAGVRWKPGIRPIICKPVLAHWNYPNGMTFLDEWTLPVHLREMEKNWVLFEAAGRLYTVYSLSPLVIFRRTMFGEWVPRVQDANDWEAEVGSHIKNSTHLLSFHGGYLGFWHYHRDRIYKTGAYWLNADLQLKARTGVIFDGAVVQPAPDIYKPGVFYVSSYVFSGDDILVFYGEGDSHSGVATLKQQALADALGIA